MRSRSSISARRFLVLAAASVGSCPLFSAAAVYTWSGTASASWSDATKWAGGVAPVAGGAIGNELIFGSPSTNTYIATNNLAGTYILSHLTFANSSRASVTVRSASGSGMQLDGPSPRIDVTGLTSHTVSNVSGGLGLALPTNVSVNIASLGDLTISAPISGAGKITVTGSELASNVGFLTISAGSGANTFSGGIDLNSGNLILDGTIATATPQGSGPLTINGGYLGFNSATTRLGTLIVNTDLRVTKGTSTWNGPITINSPSAKFQIFGASVNMNVPAAFTGKTILGGRGDYAASTGPATLTLGSNSGTTNGTLLNTAGIDLLEGATLAIDNTSTSAGANVADRVGDSIPIFMDGSNISFRANNSGSSETLGNLTVSGYSNIEVRPGATSPFSAGALTLTSLTRADHGTLFLRGQNLGVPTASPTSTSKYSTLALTSGAPNLVGGGGSDNTTSISILPWAVAAYSTTSSTSTSANSFVTYGANGFRPLNTSTEFATVLGANATDNVLISAATTNNDAAVTLNSLVLSSTTTASITGSGNLSITSGALLATLGGSASAVSNSLSFGSTEAIITTHGPLTLAGALTGTSGLTKNGTYPLILSGDNSGLKGPLTINGSSRLDITSEASLPGDGPIYIHSIASTASAGIGLGPIDGLAHNLTVSRPIVTAGGLAALDTRQAYIDAFFTGDISGNGGIIINSGASFGLVDLSGNNTYKGITRVNAGVLRIHSDSNLGNGGAVTLVTASAAQGIELAADWTTSRTIHVLNTSGIQFNQYNATLNGPLTGTALLYKFGLGRMEVNADCQYSGTLTVQDGGLVVNGFLPATVIAQGGTGNPPAYVGGTGRLGDLTLLGVLIPGSESTPVADFTTSSTTLYGGSVVAFDLGAAGDHLDVLNAFNLNSGTGTAITFLFNPVDGLTPGSSYELAKFGSTNLALSNLAYTGPDGLTGTFSLTSNALLFTVNSVPEPTSAIALVASLGSVLIGRRRRA